jgi:hypothetical protein
MTDWLGVGDSRSYDDTLCSIYGIQCILYMLYAALNACYTWYMLNLVYTILGVFLYLIYAVVSVDR